MFINVSQSGLQHTPSDIEYMNIFVPYEANRNDAKKEIQHQNPDWKAHALAADGLSK